MSKDMRRKAGSLRDATLVFVGWIAFVLGSFVEGPLRVIPLAVARVLPQVLRQTPGGV